MTVNKPPLKAPRCQLTHLSLLGGLEQALAAPDQQPPAGNVHLAASVPPILPRALLRL